MIASIVMTAAVLALYAPVLRELVAVWREGSYYAYGFLVPCFSAYLAWQTRVDDTPRAPTARGLLVLGAGLALGTAGTLAASLTLSTLSLPVTVYGAVWTLFGAARARRLAFPIGFLAFMAPLPDAVVPALSLPLQQLAAVVGEHALRVLGLPVTRQDLFLALPSVTLHVTEACNGLRFLLAMLVIATAFAGTLALPPLRGAALVLAGVTLAVGANLARVTGTGVMAELWGPQAAMGLTHVVWGKVVYAATLVPFAGLVLQMRRR
ncbi:MAG TPA: exosortase/archaeosortase family protein [Methylomirabilota bacterium]|nr:exosortase/archaeosortase family protein [Methylomirabilota bacterium]